MERIIKIKNMQSRVCKILIEKKLAEIPCVENVRISLYTKKVRLTLREDCTDKVMSVISSLGYFALVHK
jgi:copper chaperone CopZ